MSFATRTPSLVIIFTTTSCINLLISEIAFETVAMAPHMKRESRLGPIRASQWTALANEYRFGDQYAMHALNPIPHSNVSSPSPSMRDIPPGVAQGKDTARPRFQAHPYYAGGHLPFSK